MGQDRHSNPIAVARQYADPGNLAARQSIYAYQHPPLDLPAWALDLASLHGDEHVLDVGCGNGAYLAELRRRRHGGSVVAADLSAGMLRAVDQPRRVCADVQRLPFADAVFGVVLAMHMLYHAPDRSLAISEVRRVLRAGGVALVVTNSSDHLAELRSLFDRDVSETFKVETGGAELARVFERVECHEVRRVLEVDAVEPIRAYAESMMVDVDVELGVRRAALILQRDGKVRIGTAVGCFVCR